MRERVYIVHVCYTHVFHVFIVCVCVCVKESCSTMRGRIKGTDSTINAILATAMLYEVRWKIWNGAE